MPPFRSSPFVIPVMTTNAGGTAVLERIVYTTVFVSDQDSALDFYTNVLGFEQRLDNPTPDGPRFPTVGLKGQDFQLVLWPGTPGQAEPAQGRMPAAYTIETEDCREAFEAVKSRGVKFDTEVLEYPWAYTAVFQDPDGNRLRCEKGAR
jgi:catechol 2,3-dioxygenase-like lactoylglutathione lyase family enzyme